MEEFIEDVEKCDLCNNTGELVDAIGNEQIMRICASCLDKNKFPVIKKPTLEQLNLAHRFYGVKERLSNRPDLKPIKKEKSSEDKEIERIVRQTAQKADYHELINNFHWHIQHARRMKKLSQRQLAESIAEPEVIVQLAEEGKLPEDYSRLITKLEQFLKVKLKNESEKQPDLVLESSEEDQKNEETDGSGFFTSTANYFKSFFTKKTDKETEEIEGDDGNDEPEDDGGEDEMNLNKEKEAKNFDLDLKARQREEIYRKYYK